MIVEIIGMAIGSSMIDDGKRDCRTSRNLERMNQDEQSEEYQNSGNIKKASGFLIAAGCAISLVSEVMNWTK